MIEPEESAPVQPGHTKWLKGLGVVVVVGAWIGFAVAKDYRWADSWVEKMTNEGWSVAATSENAVSPIRPWTMVRNPVTVIWFMKPEWAVEVPPTTGVIAIPKVRVRYDYEGTEVEKLLALYDLSANRSTAVEPDTSLEKIDPATLSWYSPEPGTPGEDLMDFVRREVVERRLENAVDEFLKEVEELEEAQVGD